MLDFCRTLSIGSALSYLAWRVSNSHHSIIVKLRSGPRFELRPKVSCSNNDYGVAYEIFVEKQYDDHGRKPSDSVRQIVDLGANVGFTTLYLLNRYPRAKVLAFEPHPEHGKQAQRNWELGGVRNRVEFVAKGAGARARRAHFTDHMTSSQVTDEAAEGAITIDMVDLFDTLGGRKIDIFKMDIEGGEYEILADDRFAALDIDAIVMEWHSPKGETRGKAWADERLRSLGYQVEDIFNKPDYGMMWARRISQPILPERMFAR